MWSNKSIASQHKQLQQHSKHIYIISKLVKPYTHTHTHQQQQNRKMDSTFSVGGGGTVSASSTLKGSSILLESVQKPLPLIDTDIALQSKKIKNTIQSTIHKSQTL